MGGGEMQLGKRLPDVHLEGRQRTRVRSGRSQRVSLSRGLDFDLMNSGGEGDSQGSDEEEEREKVKDSGRPKGEGQFQEEEFKLQEKNRPARLEYRDEEKERITEFLRRGLCSGGWGEALYITGVPGQGKTACLLEVIKGLRGSYPEAGFYYLNGLKLSSPWLLFSRFWRQLSGDYVPARRAQGLLESAFRSGELPVSMSRAAVRRIEATKVLIIDEIDFLMTKGFEVLYSIFEWPHTKFARLVIVSVANTLDFPMVVAPKVGSRMGSCCVNFAPYTATQIEGILKDRLGDSQLFTDDAIAFVARKCAAFSSDVRKSLQTCRRAIQFFRAEKARAAQIPSENSSLPTGPTLPPRIDLSVVNRSLEFDAQKPAFLFLGRQSPAFRSFLVALLNESALALGAHKFSFDFDKVFERLLELLSQQNEKPAAYAEFLGMVRVCQQAGLIKVNRRAKERPAIALAMPADELRYLLRDDKVFERFGRVG
mgnify:CR=1 FL=1